MKANFYENRYKDKTESDSLSFKREEIDIYTLSWGPDDDGKMMDAPRIMGMRAIKDGIEKGRKGKGSIFVWGSGKVSKCQAKKTQQKF